MQHNSPYVAIVALAMGNLPGWHSQYFTDNRDGGGRMLDSRFTKGTLSLDISARGSLNLPEGGSYIENRLSRVAKTETETINKDRKQPRSR
jgi:alpha-acetolactate decarboxylase